MKPSSSTQAGSRSVKVRTLDGSKDVWGARREPKGRVVLIVLAAGHPSQIVTNLASPNIIVIVLWNMMVRINMELLHLLWLLLHVIK